VTYAINEQWLIEAIELKRFFAKRRGIISALVGKEPKYVRAVDGVSLGIKDAEILCVAGESGCGKTTLGKTIIRLLDPTEGSIMYKGKDISVLSGREMRHLRTEMQMIFQDPYESLNPRSSVFATVAEALRVNKVVKARSAEEEKRVSEALWVAGLRPPEDYFYKYPHNLSGGERQRVVTAAALVLQPNFILADEPTSMLDVSVQASLLNLLRELVKETHVAILLITHDLSVASVLSNRLAIMYLGKIVEIGPTQEVITNPAHPYTEALMSVIPTIDVERQKSPVILSGETPDPVNVPAGCRFHPRCPMSVDTCKEVEPELIKFINGHYIACHQKTLSVDVAAHDLD